MNAGIVDQTGSFVAGNFAPAQTLIGLLGCTGTTSVCAGDIPFFQGWADLVPFNNLLADLPFVQLFISGAQASSRSVNVSRVKTQVGSSLGSFLIRPVAVIPLPAALPLFGTGLGIMGFIGWRRKRRMAHETTA